MLKHKCVFTDELKAEFPYLKDDGSGKMFGSTCRSFSMEHERRSDSLQHTKIKKQTCCTEKLFVAKFHIASYYKTQCFSLRKSNWITRSHLRPVGTTIATILLLRKTNMASSCRTLVCSPHCQTQPHISINGLYFCNHKVAL